MRLAASVAALPITSGLSWALFLAFGQVTIARSSALMAATSIVLLGCVTTVGYLLNRGHWTQRTLLAHAAAGLLTGAVTIPGAGWGQLWWSAGLLSAVQAGVSLSPIPKPWVRRRKAAGGPGPLASSIPLLLVATPMVIGLAIPVGPGMAASLLAWSALPLAFAFAQSYRWSLWVLRLAYPAMTILALSGESLWSKIGIVAISGITVALSWTTDASVAVTRPPMTRTGVFPIPPELTPDDVLDAAGIDGSGRPSPTR